MENRALAFQTDTLFQGGVSRVAATEQVRDLYRRALDLHRRNLLSEAVSLYREILCAEPNHAGALHFLGMVRFSEKRLQESLEQIQRSLQICNTNAVFHNNHGVVLKELEKYPEAKAAFEKAVTINPDYPDALSNLGMICVLLGEPGAIAEKHLKKALQIRPEHPDATRHLGELYLKNGLHFEAGPLLQRLANLSQPDAQTEHRLACVCGECGDLEAAKQHFRRAAGLPGGREIWRHKYLAYCPTVFQNGEQIETYWKNLDADLDEAVAEKRLYNWQTLAAEGFTHSFNLPHLDRCCKETLEKFTALFAPSFAHFEKPNWKPRKKIRVGFLLTPGHEGGFLRLCTGLIENLDPGKFEVVLIYNETTSKRFENRFRRENLVHLRYTWNFEQAVRTIRDAKCDVIYYWKVAADTWSFFLPMARLAPIQCTSWSTQGTSGLSHIDYYVSWDKAEPKDAVNHYTERLYLLETTPLYEPVPTDIPEHAGTRDELGLPEKGAIYFCPHQMPKYHPAFDLYLREILHRDTSGHLLLLLGRSSRWNTRLMKRMENALGPELAKRVRFLPRQGYRDYYRYLSAATLVLHSPVFSGEITAVDGFLYGIPYVTQSGDFLVQRYSTAFYEEFGIEGLSVTKMEEYVAQALRLGTDAEYRRSISRQILEKSKPFFENQNTVRQWERFFTEAVENAGAKSRSFL